MPTSKTKDLRKTARLFHALADETRLRVIDCLLACEQCVCDLTEDLRMSQPLLSFHLKTLKDVGLLRDRREGRWIYYSLNPETLEEVREFVQSLKAPKQEAKGGTGCCE